MFNRVRSAAGRFQIFPGSGIDTWLSFSLICTLLIFQLIVFCKPATSTANFLTGIMWIIKEVCHV